MSDVFKASYGEMTTMAGRLDDGRETITDTVNRLKADVDALLGQDFRTQHASEKFGEGYTKMTDGYHKALEGMGGMAENLRKMVDGIKDTDRQLSGD